MRLVKSYEDSSTHFLILTQEQLILVEASQKELAWYIKTEMITDVKRKRNGIVISLAEEFEGNEQFTLQVDEVSAPEIANWLNAIAYQFN